jgi:hypothetical protein
MNNNIFRARILVAIIFFSFVFINTANCGEVAVMITEELYIEGVNCKLYPINGYYQNVIHPLRDELPKIKSENQIKVIVSGLLLTKQIELQHKYSDKNTFTTLKEMKKNGWKIVSVEVLTGSVYALNRALKAYADEDDHAHIFIFEK